MLNVNAELTGFSRIDFDRKKIRKAFQLEGREIRKAARRLVARRAVSGVGEYPGRRTGRLQRSIRLKVFKSGFGAVVRPEKTAEMGDDFYPAFLHYGVTGRLAPRKNYMVEALESRRDRVRYALRAALQESLVPRK